MNPSIDSRSIVLIQPPSTLQKLQRIKAKRPEIEAPLPFVYLAPYLLDAGFNVHVLDLRIDSVSTLERNLRELRPLIAGVSVMPGSMLRDTIEVTRRIKQASPATKTIWGGTFPTLHYRICLQVPDLDFVACGDGEWTLRELATALADNDNASAWKGIPGLAYQSRRRNSDHQAAGTGESGRATGRRVADFGSIYRSLPRAFSLALDQHRQRMSVLLHVLLQHCPLSRFQSLPYKKALKRRSRKFDTCIGAICLMPSSLWMMTFSQTGREVWRYWRRRTGNFRTFAIGSMRESMS